MPLVPDLTGPSFLPIPAQRVLPGVRDLVTTTARRHGLCLEDAWDEAVGALIRATIHFNATQRRRDPARP